jgi:hypothetical protein
MRGDRLLVGVAAIAVLAAAVAMMSGPGFTGRMIGSTEGELTAPGQVLVISGDHAAFGNPGFGILEFTARVDGPLEEHGSWQLGGFTGSASSPSGTSDPRAVFYADVGVMKAFVRDSEGTSWCAPFGRDWTQEHVFRIESLQDRTRFLVDGAEVCSIPRAAGALPVMFSQKDPAGGMRLLVREARLL